MNDDEKTSLDFWFPLVCDVVPVPKTVIVPTRCDLSWLLDGKAPSGYGKFLAALDSAAQEVGGYPFFMRTGLTSGKHDWLRTCFVPSRDALDSHVAALVEFSALADMRGLATDVWVARELLHTEPSFLAFMGMPITRERRYFVRDGRILGHQPYWPPDALIRPDCDDWLERLTTMQMETAEEVEELSALSLRVSDAVPGCWSVDWLWTSDRGWVLTDMAVGQRSFVWVGYPDAPSEEDLVEK